MFFVGAKTVLKSDTIPLEVMHNISVDLLLILKEHLLRSWFSLFLNFRLFLKLRNAYKLILDLKYMPVSQYTETYKDKSLWPFMVWVATVDQLLPIFRLREQAKGILSQV